MENGFFPIFSLVFQDICHFIHLWNIPKFLWFVWGLVHLGFGVLSIILAGVVGMYKPMEIKNDSGTFCKGLDR